MGTATAPVDAPKERPTPQVLAYAKQLPNSAHLATITTGATKCVRFQFIGLTDSIKGARSKWVTREKLTDTNGAGPFQASDI